jgi:hypothetical protein
LVTFVASSLTIGFDAFIVDLMSQSRDFACRTSPSPSMTPPRHILLAFPSSDEDSERSPALDLHAIPVDDLTGDDGAAAALGAYLDCDAPF